MIVSRVRRKFKVSLQWRDLRFAICDAIRRATWCAYNEKRFATRFVICDAICDVAKRDSAYNVVAIAKRRRFAICDVA